MKCLKCSANAAINMREHHLALCRRHFVEWVQTQTAHSIHHFRMFPPGSRLLLAVSGGKDSLSLWDVLLELGYPVDGLHINLSIESDLHYSQASEEACRSFSAQRNVHLQVFDLQNIYNIGIYEMARRKTNQKLAPCSVCGLVKRHAMNQAAVEGGYDCLVTAHNLDDEAAVLFANTLEWNADLIRRQAPVLPAAPGFSRKAKPFCRLYERESAAYAVLRNIDFVEDECPYAVGSKQLQHKEDLNRMEVQHPARKYHFYNNFLKARETGLFQLSGADQEGLEKTLCPQCGQPTTSTDLCAYCRLIQQVTTPN
jgi:tRNA-5-methyluridine54 2-sulfurtransferase